MSGRDERAGGPNLNTVRLLVALSNEAMGLVHILTRAGYRGGLMVRRDRYSTQ
jgi:hypothetical protein